MHSSLSSFVNILFCLLAIIPTRSVLAFFGTRSSRHHSLLPWHLFQSTSNDINNNNEAAAAAELRSITFQNIHQQQEPATLCEFLMELGACSVSMTDADRNTAQEVPAFGEPAYNDDERLLWLPPVWNHCHVTAHFPASVQMETLIETVQDFMENSSDDNQTPLFMSYQLDAVPNRDWVVHVQQSWKPIVVANKFLLTFPWHNDTQIQDLLSSSTSSLIPLVLQGGVAFGTGEHPTTQLCLEWLSIQHISSENKDETDKSLVFLDYGSGSGILGMAAAKVHPHLTQIIGIDLDVDACLIANANARINHVDMFNYLPPLEWFGDTADAESASLLYKAYARVGDHTEVVWPAESSSFPLCDICVANILAAPLIQLAPLLLRLLRPGAKLGMSGILASQQDMVTQAYEAAGFVNVHRPYPVQAGWILLQAETPLVV